MNGDAFGRVRYFADVDSEFGRLFVAVPCFVGDREEPITALFDPACEWCMMPARVAETLGFDLLAGGNTRIHTRFGLISGRLEIVSVLFRSSAGQPPEVENYSFRLDSTWFISEEWPGPAVIGWKGCLERMRFGVDPSQDLFYFAGFEDDTA